VLAANPRQGSLRSPSFVSSSLPALWNCQWVSLSAQSLRTWLHSRTLFTRSQPGPWKFQVRSARFQSIPKTGKFCESSKRASDNRHGHTATAHCSSCSHACGGTPSPDRNPPYLSKRHRIPITSFAGGKITTPSHGCRGPPKWRGLARVGIPGASCLDRTNRAAFGSICCEHVLLLELVGAGPCLGLGVNSGWHPNSGQRETKGDQLVAPPHNHSHSPAWCRCIAATARTTVHHVFGQGG
jgi:hypothetical protein